MADLFTEDGADESIASDWADIQEKHATPEVEEAPVHVAETEERAAPVDDAAKPVVDAKPAADRARADDGKFVKQPKVKESKAGAQPAQAAQEAIPPVQEGAAPAADASPARDLNRAPSSWKATARAEWEKIPPTLRAEIHRREADFSNGQAQLMPDAQMGREMRQTIEPFRALIEQTGAPASRVIGDVLRDVAMLRTGTEQQKYQTVAKIAQFHGVDLRRFAAQPGQPQPQPQPSQQQFRDPRVDQLLQQRHQEQQDRLRTEQQQQETTVNRWMNEADADGQPKRPYISDVFNEMLALVPQVMQGDPTLTHAQALDAAYDRATWANPDVRTLLAKKQQTDLETQRLTENQRKVAAAKRAGSVSVARRASIPSAGPPGTMEETIGATARELGFFS